MPVPDDWNDLLAAQLQPGDTCRLKVNGRSMLPLLQPGDWLTIRCEPAGELQIGDRVVFREGHGLTIHRLVERRGIQLVFKGDARLTCDAPVLPEAVLGRVIALERAGQNRSLAQRTWVDRLIAKCSRWIGYFYSKIAAVFQ
jgi:SOS-response transcriptional repressor LexA